MLWVNSPSANSKAASHGWGLESQNFISRGAVWPMTSHSPALGHAHSRWYIKTEWAGGWQSAEMPVRLRFCGDRGVPRSLYDPLGDPLGLRVLLWCPTDLQIPLSRTGGPGWPVRIEEGRSAGGSWSSERRGMLSPGVRGSPSSTEAPGHGHAAASDPFTPPRQQIPGAFPCVLGA